MFSRRGPQVRPSQRIEAGAILGIGTSRQNVLALTVRRALRRAGMSEAAYEAGVGIDSRLLQSGFVIEAPPAIHGDSSIGVVYAGARDDAEKAIAKIAEILVGAFTSVLGQEGARQIVQVRRQRIPDSADSFIGVRVKIPGDAALRALYRKLGRG